MLSKFFSKCHAKMLGWKCRKTSWNGWGGENVRSGWYKQGRRDDTWRPGICLFLFDPCSRTLSCVLYLPPRCLSPFHFVMSRSCDIQLLVRLVTNFCFTRWKTFYSLFCKNGEIRWFFFLFWSCNPLLITSYRACCTRCVYTARALQFMRDSTCILGKQFWLICWIGMCE